MVYTQVLGTCARKSVEVQVLSSAQFKITMSTKKQIKKICSRGHTFYKSSDCPVCPTCWSGYYREKNKGAFPDKLAAPALRALLNAGIVNPEQLSKYSENEILKLHGMGPSSIPLLRKALNDKHLTFRKD